MADHLFIAADVGNARIKLGLFEQQAGGGSPLADLPGDGLAPIGSAPVSLPEPLRTLSLVEEKSPHGAAPSFRFDQIEAWLTDVSDDLASWCVASVNRPAATQLIEWLRGHRPSDRVALLATDDLPLSVRLPRPDMVGIDRLVDALAANRLRRPARAAAIVDVGSAITVDLVSADGVFQGGAILPGINMSARALHHFTDLLPLVDMSDLGTPPPPVGIDTASAIRSGLYWGAVGAVRQLVEQLHQTATGASHSRPQVFLTGGAGATVADLLGGDARFVPNLTLSGIALAAARLL